MAMTNREELARDLFNVCRLTGQFRLRSGAVSGHYFDKYRFESNPKLLERVATSLRNVLPTNVDALLGLELGGVPVATALSLVTGIPAFFVRKVAKEYGTCQLVEGGEIASRRVVIIEDVITSGGQVILSAAEIRKLGADIRGVLCVIDRESGGREALAASNLALTSLFTESELLRAAGKTADR
jgi:orotate phosphoribosyltransferase